MGFKIFTVIKDQCLFAQKKITMTVCTLITQSADLNSSVPLNVSNDNLTVLQNTTTTLASDDDFIGFRTMEKGLYEYCLPTACCFGVIGNILNLAILSRKSLQMRMEKLEQCAHSHLIALAFSDLMYCVTLLPRAYMPTFVQSSYISPWLLYEVYKGAVFNTFLLISSWLTVAMAVSRYIAICYPVKARQRLGVRTTRMGIACIVIISVIFNVPRYFTKVIYSMECQEGGYLYFAFCGPLCLNHAREQIYLWIYFLVGIVIPLIVVAYCNIFFIRALSSSKNLQRQHSNQRYQSSSLSTSSNPSVTLTLTLSIIVVLYILMVTPAEIIQFFKPLVRKQFRDKLDVLAYYSLAAAICNNLQVLNFAVNFLLYCLINVHFRRVITNVLCFRRSSSTKHVRKVTWGERSSMLSNTTNITLNSQNAYI